MSTTTPTMSMAMSLRSPMTVLLSIPKLLFPLLVSVLPQLSTLLLLSTLLPLFTLLLSFTLLQLFTLLPLSTTPVLLARALTKPYQGEARSTSQAKAFGSPIASVSSSDSVSNTAQAGLASHLGQGVIG